MKHLLSLEKLPREDMEVILENAKVFKRRRGDTTIQPLAGKTWALIFTKSSTRTRVSFEVGAASPRLKPPSLSVTSVITRLTF